MSHQSWSLQPMRQASAEFHTGQRFWQSIARMSEIWPQGQMDCQRVPPCMPTKMPATTRSPPWCRRRVLHAWVLDRPVLTPSASLTQSTECQQSLDQYWHIQITIWHKNNIIKTSVKNYSIFNDWNFRVLLPKIQLLFITHFYISDCPCLFKSLGI